MQTVKFCVSDEICLGPFDNTLGSFSDFCRQLCENKPSTLLKVTLVIGDVLKLSLKGF